MVFITHVRMAGTGTRHEHIAEVKWRNPSTNEVGQSTVAAMVDFIEIKKGAAKVSDARGTVDVIVVAAVPKHIRTVADGRLTDNLLALPPF